MVSSIGMKVEGGGTSRRAEDGGIGRRAEGGDTGSEITFLFSAETS